MTLYIPIIVYILSLIAGLFLMAVVKSVTKKQFYSVTFIHVLSLLLYLLVPRSMKDGETSYNFTFMFYICSGIMLAGLAWRSTVHLLFKIYFTLFGLTVLLFIFSPSRLIVFLLTGKYTETMGKTFPVGENYFLEQQNTTSGIKLFKLISKHGMFHETIQRNLDFNGALDSIHVLDFIPKEKAIIRGYSSKATYVSSETDSVDVEVRLVKENKSQIERRKY